MLACLLVCFHSSVAKTSASSTELCPKRSFHGGFGTRTGAGFLRVTEFRVLEFLGLPFPPSFDDKSLPKSEFLL